MTNFHKFCTGSWPFYVEILHYLNFVFTGICDGRGLQSFNNIGKNTLCLQGGYDDGDGGSYGNYDNNFMGNYGNNNRDGYENSASGNYGNAGVGNTSSYGNQNNYSNPGVNFGNNVSNYGNQGTGSYSSHGYSNYGNSAVAGNYGNMGAGNQSMMNRKNVGGMWNTMAESFTGNGEVRNERVFLGRFTFVLY